MSSAGDLDARLLEAHGAGDTRALITLYGEAGHLALASGDKDAGCFFLTHAYVFALHLGDGRAADLHAVLVEHGREA